LHNKICGLNSPTPFASESSTRWVNDKPTAHGNYSMDIRDTPGIGAYTEKMHHALALRAALTRSPVTAVVVTIQLSSRLETMYTAMQTALSHITGYSGKVIACVTCWDQLPSQSDPVAIFNKYRAEFSQRFKVDRLMCVGTQTGADVLCNSLYEIASQIETSTIVIDEEKFKHDFDILPNAQEAEKEMRKLQDQFAVRVIAAKEYIAALPRGDENRDVLLHALLAQMKADAEALSCDFGLKYLEAFDQINSYIHYTRLKKELETHVGLLVADVQAQMSFDPTNPRDIRNLVRKCPHCSLLWWKVEGCDGQTTCGRRPSRVTDDYYGLTLQSFVFEYVAGKMTCFMHQDPATTSSPKKEKNTPSSTVKPAGCGREFVWSSAMLLTKSELDALLRVLSLTIEDFMEDRFDLGAKEAFVNRLRTADDHPDEFYDHGISAPSSSHPSSSNSSGILPGTNEVHRQGSGSTRTTGERVKEPLTVAELLDALQLSEYLPRFVAENVDMPFLRKLSRNDLQDMGLPLKARVAIFNGLHPEDRNH